MKIYVAAKYARGPELLRDVLPVLEAGGHECTSRWITQGEEGKSAAEAAQMDLDDIQGADAILFFGEPTGSANRGGGRWFELGYAHCAGLYCFVICDQTGGSHDICLPGHETVFTALPGILCFDSLDDLLASGELDE